jgi:hypothetical protein
LKKSIFALCCCSFSRVYLDLVCGARLLSPAGGLHLKSWFCEISFSHWILPFLVWGFGLRCYVKALPSFVWVSELTEQQFQLPILSQLAWPGFFLVTASSIWSGLSSDGAQESSSGVLAHE